METLIKLLSTHTLSLASTLKETSPDGAGASPILYRHSIGPMRGLWLGAYPVVTLWYYHQNGGEGCSDHN
jgi:hypothetical protein